ncbi:C-type lectin domain family 4 member F-like isoform X2 [Macrobrachium rosenbergii]|uniref:C-type lectin domain family 4 member F-like isoform X2 n=1 Tax=Macrobrachium rosenbergii TaxID=79674 RepID=UPI0034D3FC78
MKAFWCLFALGIFLQIPEGQAQCPPPFETFVLGGSGVEFCLYFDMEVKRDWHEGRTACQSLGSDLADLDYEDLHWQVISYIHKHQDMANEGFHIACTDEATEGEWLWTDGRQVDILSGHWYPGQPDGGRRENYGCLYPDVFMYNSCVTGQKLYTICMI